MSQLKDYLIIYDGDMDELIVNIINDSCILMGRYALLPRLLSVATTEEYADYLKTFLNIQITEVEKNLWKLNHYQNDLRLIGQQSDLPVNPDISKYGSMIYYTHANQVRSIGNIGQMDYLNAQPTRVTYLYYLSNVNTTFYPNTPGTFNIELTNPDDIVPARVRLFTTDANKTPFGIHTNSAFVFNPTATSNWRLKNNTVLIRSNRDLSVSKELEVTSITKDTVGTSTYYTLQIDQTSFLSTGTVFPVSLAGAGTWEITFRTLNFGDIRSDIQYNYTTPFTGKGVDIMVVEVEDFIGHQFENHPLWLDKSKTRSRLIPMNWSQVYPGLGFDTNIFQSTKQFIGYHPAGSLSVSGGLTTGFGIDSNLRLIYVEGDGFRTYNALVYYEFYKPADEFWGFKTPTIVNNSYGIMLGMMNGIRISDITRIQYYLNDQLVLKTGTTQNPITVNDCKLANLHVMYVKVRKQTGTFRGTPTYTNVVEWMVVFDGGNSGWNYANDFMNEYNLLMVYSAANDCNHYAKYDSKEWRDTKIVAKPGHILYKPQSRFGTITDLTDGQSETQIAGEVEYFPLQATTLGGYDNVINVAAMQSSDAQPLLTSYSARGYGIDIVADTSMFSAYPGLKIGNDWYGMFGGTSCAGPVVTGILAALADKFMTYNKRAPSPRELKAVLINESKKGFLRDPVVADWPSNPLPTANYDTDLLYAGKISLFKHNPAGTEGSFSFVNGGVHDINLNGTPNRVAFIDTNFVRDPSRDMNFINDEEDPVIIRFPYKIINNNNFFTLLLLSNPSFQAYSYINLKLAEIKSRYKATPSYTLSGDKGVLSFNEATATLSGIVNWSGTRAFTITATYGPSSRANTFTLTPTFRNPMSIQRYQSLRVTTGDPELSLQVDLFERILLGVVKAFGTNTLPTTGISPQLPAGITLEAVDNSVQTDIDRIIYYYIRGTALTTSSRTLHTLTLTSYNVAQTLQFYTQCTVPVPLTLQTYNINTQYLSKTASLPGFDPITYMTVQFSENVKLNDLVLFSCSGGSDIISKLPSPSNDGRRTGTRNPDFTGTYSIALLAPPWPSYPSNYDWYELVEPTTIFAYDSTDGAGKAVELYRPLTTGTMKINFKKSTIGTVPRFSIPFPTNGRSMDFKINDRADVNKVSQLNIKLRPRTPYGEALFITPGTIEWTVPDGVFQVSVVCIGGGGSGSTTIKSFEDPSDPDPRFINTNFNHPDSWKVKPSGGGGGGLAYRNSIEVTPGQKIFIQVGQGGAPSLEFVETDGTIRGGDGGDSYFGSRTLVCGYGGRGGYTRGGMGGPMNYGFAGNGGGGAGGPGSDYPNNKQFLGAGGGAGGYSPAGSATGGAGQLYPFNSRSTLPSQFGGGGAGGLLSGPSPTGGGGTEVYGLGPDGSYITKITETVNSATNQKITHTAVYPGTGSLLPECYTADPHAGDTLSQNGVSIVSRNGALFGGGGAYQGLGASGAVRVIWGGNNWAYFRQFPSTNTKPIIPVGF